MKFLASLIFLFFGLSSVFSEVKAEVLSEAQVKSLVIPKLKFESKVAEFDEALKAVLKDKDIYLFFDKDGLKKLNNENLYKFDFENYSLEKIISSICSEAGLDFEFYSNAVVLYKKGSNVEKIRFNRFYLSSAIPDDKLKEKNITELRNYVSGNGIVLDFKTTVAWTGDQQHLFFMGNFMDLIRFDELMKQTANGRYGLVSTELSMPVFTKFKDGKKTEVKKNENTPAGEGKTK